MRRWLPSGRAGGLAYGALLLVVAGTRLEPLRRSNLDFDLVGPGWVSVVGFSAVVLFHAMLVAALAGRVSRALPLLGRKPRTIVAHAPLLLLALVPPIAVALAVLGGLAVLATKVRPMIAVWHSRGLNLAGQVVLALVALAALPGFVADVSNILRRGQVGP